MTSVTPLFPPCPNCRRPACERVELARTPDRVVLGCQACLAEAREAASYLRRFAPSLLRW